VWCVCGVCVCVCVCVCVVCVCVCALNELKYFRKKLITAIMFFTHVDVMAK